MSEIYSAKERLIIFLVLLEVALVTSFVYLFFRVDYKQMNIAIFIISLLYATTFVFLNLIAVFDLIFADEEGFAKLLKLFSRFYKIFTWIDKALGFVIFNILIAYLESGYHQIYLKLADMFIRIYNNKKKRVKVK